MLTAEKNVLTSEMNEFVWKTTPMFFGQKLSPQLGRLLSDGSYLSSSWRYAFVLPSIFFTLALIVGGTHLAFVGYEVYTFSVFIMVAMVLPAAFSSSLGTWICIGYALGDLFIYRYGIYLRQEETVSNFLLKGIAPRIIPIGYLFLLLVTLPLAGRKLASAMLAWLGPALDKRKILAPVLCGLVTGLMVYAWTKAVPLLIRPVYSWELQPMPPGLPPLYDKGWELSLIMGLAVLARTVVESKTRAILQVWSYLNDNESGRTARVSKRNLFSLLFTTIVSTFLLSALYTTWRDAALVAAIVLIASTLRTVLIPRQKKWIRMVGRWPMLARLAGGLILCWVFYKYVGTPNVLHHASDDPQIFIASIFKNILYTVLVVILYYTLLFPDQSSSRKSKYAL